MFDSHTHLDWSDDPDGLVTAARQAGVHGMTAVGCGAASIRATLEVARRHASAVRVAAGVHPQAAATFDMAQFEEVAELARDPLVVAIGETGFDQFRDHGSLAEQQPAFVAQARLARELALPLIIHSRAAEAHTIAMLEEHAEGLDVVLHCFALAAPPFLARVVAHDSWVCSFAGNVTYPSAGELRDAAAAVPAHRLMAETDAPYLTPVPHRGQRNQPAYVQHVVQTLADARGETFAETRAATQATAERVFRFAPEIAP